jgi:hypothetical protein
MQRKSRELFIAVGHRNRRAVPEPRKFAPHLAKAG